MKYRRTIILICITISALICCQKAPELISNRFFKMDTVTEISLVTNDEKKAQRLWKSVDSLLVSWDERFSVEGEKSEIRALNERTEDTLKISPIAAEMISGALAYGDTLDGGFDITILPIKELWGFGESDTVSKPVPSDSAIKAALKKVNYKNVKVVDDTVIFTSKRTEIDVGGIAKGFVLRELAKIVEQYGFEDYLIVAGGDIVSSGMRPNGKLWRIGIQHPRASDSVIAVVELDSGSIVTSGDYERFKIIDGKRYHHIFDSHTGYSCTKNQSVTIMGPDPVEVDVMSTGLFCRDANEILEFVNKRDRLEGLIIDSAGNVFASDGWKNITPFTP